MSWQTLQNSKAFKEAKYYFKAFGMKGPQTRKALLGLRKEFQKIERDYGELTVDAVLQEAEDEANPLHPYFEWDDAVAACAHRRNQARKLISSVWVEFKDPKNEKKVVHTQVYINKNVASGVTTQKPYQDIKDVMANPAERKEHLQIHLRAAQAWAERCKAFEELTELVKLIEKLAKKYKA